MAIIYVHPTTGNDGSGDGLSFATGYKTLGKALAMASPLDEIRLPKSNPPIAATVTANFTNDSEDVVLSSAVTKEMDNGLSAWGMGYTGLVSTTTNWGIVGLNVIQIEYNPTGGVGEPPAGANRIFWTPTTFSNYTGYEQISMVFNLRTSGTFLSGPYAGQYVYNFFEIKLCSDTAGLVPVHTVSFPTGIQNLANTVFPLTLNLGVDIGSIQSIAIWTTPSFPGYVSSSFAESTKWQIINVVACLPTSSVDAITHSSIIGKDTLSDPRWFPVRYILGTSLKIGGGYKDPIAYNFGIAPNQIGSLSYAGTTESTPLFHMNPKTFYQDTTATSLLKRITKSVSITGGWTDETTLSTRKTWFVATDLLSAVFSSDTSTFLEIESNPALEILLKNVGLYGFTQGVVKAQSGGGVPDVLTTLKYEECHAICVGLVANSPTTTIIFQSCVLGHINRGAEGNTSVTGWSNSLFIRNSTVHNCSGAVFNYAQAQRVEANDTVIQNGFSETFRLLSSAGRFKNITYYSRPGMLTSPNLISTPTSGQTKEIIIDGLTTNTSYIPFTFSSTYPVKVMRYNALDDHRIYYGSQSPSPFALSSTSPVGLIRSETGVDRYTPSGIAWKFSPLNAYITEFTPLEIPLTKLYIDTINSITVSVWAKRDNIGIFGRLILPANQAGAPSTDVKADFVAAAGSYAQLSITFTPILSNVVLDIYFRVWGGTSFNFWVDEVVVT